jgi:hypothetical protein
LAAKALKEAVMSRRGSRPGARKAKKTAGRAVKKVAKKTVARKAVAKKASSRKRR